VAFFFIVLKKEVYHSPYRSTKLKWRKRGWRGREGERVNKKGGSRRLKFSLYFNSAEKGAN
jgi:hypothetical protein